MSRRIFMWFDNPPTLEKSVAGLVLLDIFSQDFSCFIADIVTVVIFSPNVGLIFTFNFEG